MRDRKGSTARLTRCLSRCARSKSCASREVDAADVVAEATKIDVERLIPPMKVTTKTLPRIDDSNAVELLTRGDLAAVLRVSTRTLDRFRAAGEILNPLPGVGQPRWHAPEVRDWVAAGRPNALGWSR